MASKSKRNFFRYLYETSEEESEVEGLSPQPQILAVEQNREKQPETTGPWGCHNNAVEGPKPPTLQRSNKSDSALLKNSKRKSEPQRQKYKSLSSTRKVPSKEPVKQIFHGLKFYFYPRSNGIDRKIRIQRCEEYGAECVKDWANGSGITHAIFDRPERQDCTYQTLLKELKIDVLPLGVDLVKYNFIGDCMRGGMLFRATQKHYWVPGFDGPPTEKPATPRELSTPHRHSESTRSTTTTQSPITKRLNIGRKPPATDISRPAQKAVTAQDTFKFECTPKVLANWRSNAEKNYMKKHSPPLDALYEVIQEVKDLGDLLPDDETDGAQDEDQVEEPDRDSVSVEGKIHESSQMDLNKDLKQAWQNNFACMRKNDGKEAQDNPNAQTIEILQRLATHYDKIGDHWRTTAYRKAINSLHRQSHFIASKREAQALSSVGESIAAKIEEIVETRQLRHLNAAEADETERARQIFLNIYGVGRRLANIWIAKGYQTIEDIKTKETLTDNQKVGVEHYNDFLQRIPRDEIKRHEALMDKAISEVSPHLQATIGGSYRRGTADSGDIDFLITSPSLPLDVLSGTVFEELVPQLYKLGYLKHDLAVNRKKRGTKWHGAASLPTDTLPWRRVDIMVAPWAELGAARIHFTGNDLFNRSMRLLARRKGMRLNEHGLWQDVLRGRNQQKISQGTLIESYDEEKIFAALGVPWRPPEHRCI